MKKIAKKITALMLSLAMLLGCVPSFVNEASATTYNITYEVPKSKSERNTFSEDDINFGCDNGELNSSKEWGGRDIILLCFQFQEGDEASVVNSSYTVNGLSINTGLDYYEFLQGNFPESEYGIVRSTETRCVYVYQLLDLPEVKSISELATLIDEANPGDTIVLDSDYMFTDGVDKNESIIIDKELSITMQGHTIDGNGKTDTIFRVNNGGKLIFNNSTGCIKNARQGNVSVGNGGVVVSNYCKMDGGQDGFYVAAGGTLVCNNVYITNMTHAGMSIADGGLLIFDGGIISDCKYGIYLKGTGYFGTQPIVKDNVDYNILFFNSADIYTGAYSNINGSDYSSHDMNYIADISFYCSYLKDTDKEMVLAHGHEKNSYFVDYIKIENADCELSVNDNNEFIIKHLIKKIKFRLFPESGLIFQSDIDKIEEYRSNATFSGANDFSLSYGDVDGKYYELIDFTFGSKAQADLIETIEFEGMDITDKKVTCNVTRDSVKTIAFLWQDGCAWGRLDDTTIIAAKYLKLSDSIDYTFSGTTVGSNIKDVTITRKLNGENIATPPLVSFYEVPSTGSNVKIWGDNLETAKFEADKKYLIEVIDGLDDNDNADCAFVNDELFTKAATISGNPKSTEWTFTSSSEAFLNYVFTPSNPPSSGGSKKYKANDNDTAEKVSGSGKKGSTRTIIPEEGRKVTNVKVTDKKGNPVEVTMNEDGTYSFIQPASDVIIDVDYQNREIMMEVGTIGATVDGIAVNEYVTPKVRGNEVMLPVRFIAENLGAKVDWNEKEPNMIYITRGDKKIEIKLGSNVFKVNGEEITLDSASFAEGNRTYVPFKLIEEALNATVELGSTNSNEIAIKEF